MFIKLGETNQIVNVQEAEEALLDPDVQERFKKIAAGIRKVAPKASDFLYFSAIMMHAAEASALNDDGTPKLYKGEPVKVGWDVNEKTGSWKWKTSDRSISPYKNCFVPGTEILMEDGSVKNIEDIKIGDVVISHKGQPRKVLNTFVNDIDKDILELSIRNNRKILTTAEHPFYKLNVKTKSKANPKKLIKNAKLEKEFNFIEASELNKYDLLTCPKVNYMSSNKLSDKEAKLLGYFAAEGSYSKKNSKYYGAVFTFNINERETYAKEVKELCELIFKGCSVSLLDDKDGSTCAVYAYNKNKRNNIVKFFKDNIGEYSKEKTLSKDIVFGSNSVKKNFILGWMCGDGHISKNYQQAIGITVSKNLANQIKTMLNSLEIGSSLRFLKSDGKLKTINKNYKPTTSSDLYRIEINATEAVKILSDFSKLKNGVAKKKQQSLFFNNYAIYTVLDKVKVPYVGKVYNFEVDEDNSYIANGIAVHNCNGDIFPRSELLKAYKNWIGKPLCIDHKSNSVDHVRGVIVDTYYDKLHDRVIALAAIDKVNYADLARKVATGYANSVSMGVGVSKAICSDCGKVAQVEQDFCNHMKTKTGYGEINIGLNPIELSIVVNGADPKAKIKQVLASANFVRKALDSENSKSDLVDELKNKFDEIKTKLDDLGSKIDSLEDQEEENFDETGDNEVGHISSSSESMHEAETENVNNTGFGQGVRADKQELLQKLASVETNLNNLMKDLKRFNEEQMSVKKAYFQGGGDVNEPTPGKPKYDKEEADSIRNNDDKQMVGQMDTGPVDGMHPGPESVGMNELERKKMLARAEVDERRIRRAAALKDAKERILGAKESFAQATGTVKDMKAGQALASASVCLRDKHGNKTLAGQVAQVSDQLKMNGIGAGSLHQILQALKMYSTDPTVMNGVVELERVLNTKQASNNTGTMKREGYFQGGGDANEPTPGKVKYKPESEAESTRNKEDKQMTGEKPFPNVGPVDGEFPGDKKKKEMLSRADKLSARFVKSADTYGDLDKGSSAWQVFLNDKLVMTASVNELTGNKSEILYEAVANKEFATKMLEKIRSVGLDGAKRLYKQAQTPPAPPPPAPDMGMGMDMGAAPPADPGAPVDQAGAEGDPKEKVNSAVTTLENAVSDLKEGLTALNGEQPQVATDVDLNAMPKAAARELAPLKQMRVKLNSELRAGFKKAIAKITEQLEELNTVKEIYASSVSNDQKEYISVIVDDSLKAATQSTKEAKELLAAFVKYAKGTEALIKRAEMAEDEMPKDFEDELHDSGKSDLDELDQKMKEEDHVDLEDTSMDSGEDVDSGDSDQEVEDALKEMGLGEDSNMDDDSDEDMFSHGDHDVVTDDSDEDSVDHGDMESMLDDDDSGMADDVMVPMSGDTKLSDVKGLFGKASFNLNTKEGRAQYRAKLASDAVKFSDMLGKAHPKGGTTVDFDVKPSNKGDHFEDLEEAHKVMLDVAKASPKVRKDAEEIYKLVSSGELDANQVDDLVAQGVDAEAVKYYKEYFGEADGGSEFASELVKDHAKASAEKDMETYRVKLARAYDLAYEMVSRELIPSDNQAVTAQVNEIMTWNDEGFASMKKVIARHSVSSLKKEGSFPTVGLMDSANYAPKADEDFTDLLSKALSGAGRRMF